MGEEWAGAAADWRGGGCREEGELADAAGRYVLATGAEGAERLRIVNEVHGSDTERLLREAGLGPGLRVADIGCGIGTVSAWMAEQVGPRGEVVGVDVSPEQIAQAREMAAPLALPQLRFAVGGASDTGLPRGAFDLVFCRFVLMHMRQPEAALREMAALLRPGGLLVCEDGDFTSPFCEPPSAAFDRCFELYLALGAARGADFRIGPKLYRMFLEAGFTSPQVALAQPAIVRGPAKRLPEWTLQEAAPALLEARLATEQEIDALLLSMQALAEDDTVLFGMARMTQVRARKG